ncbi:hypothetical protein Btru_033816 [Bulinus truncatus]|nr:hypothetical protein Btru_033816 [Bulinus truncatus]
MGLLLVIPFYFSVLLNLFTALEINVSHPVFDAVFSRHLQLKCSLKHVDNSSMKTLESLLISHSAKVDNPEFLDLASVNTTNGEVNGALLKATTASGVIDNQGESYLELTWDFPSKRLTGVYRCEATGVSANDTIWTESNTTVVRSITPSLSKVLKNFLNMTQYVKQMDKKLKFMQKTSEVQTSFQKTILQLTLQSLFYESSKFNGRKYYLSRNSATFAQSSAQEICKLYGGHLAEINTNEEFKFVKNFLAAKNVLDYVLTGSSDEEQEGNWTNIYSKAPLKVFNWAKGQPNDGRSSNCQCFWRDVKWYMADCRCDLSYRNAGYVCEIPV